MKTTLGIFLFWLVFVQTNPVYGQIPILIKINELPFNKQIEISESEQKSLLKTLNIQMDKSILKSPIADKLSISLFDNKTFTIEKSKLNFLGNNSYIWEGTIIGQPGSSVTFSVVNNSAVGEIVMATGEVYRVGYLDNQLNSLLQINLESILPEGPPREQAAANGPVPDSNCNESGATLDVLAVYTSAAMAKAGGPDAMRAILNKAVSDANESYQNSGVTQRLNLVHAEMVNYTETGNLNTDLSNLQSGAIPNVAALRNNHSADLVSLIVETGNYCGLGYIMRRPSATFENSAFNVVTRSCTQTNFSFAHELGHNMGADHDDDNAGTAGDFPFNRGHIDIASSVEGERWRDIMAYPTNPQSSRKKYWSNSTLPGYLGRPAGIVNRRENQRVLNSTARVIANFRCRQN